MRGHRWGARALAVAVAALAAAGCGAIPSSTFRDAPARIPGGGTFIVEPGEDVIIYGVRARRCGMPPPTFETAAGEMFSGEGAQGPQAGEVFDAGTGQRVAVLCGGQVPVRAIGYRAPEGFEGEVTMVFYGTDQATVTVARPPEPEPEEPEEDAEDEAEPAAEETPDADAEPETEGAN
jgi:hypothetical protein